jgi:beta-glucosidase
MYWVSILNAAPTRARFSGAGRLIGGKYINRMVLCALFSTLCPLAAQETLWPTPPFPPPLAAGVNPTTVPIPVDGWFLRVQENIKNAKSRQVDLIFDGDSITDWLQYKGPEVWKKYYAPRQAFDFGIAGDQIEHVLWRLKEGQVDGLHPKLVVLLIGTNDFKTRDTDDQIAEGIHNLWHEYSTRLPEARFLTLGIFPRGPHATDPLRARIIHINEMLGQYHDNPKITYLDIGNKFLDAQGEILPDIMSDFLHPTPKGYEIWAQAIEDEVAKVIPLPVAEGAQQP